MLGRVSLGLRTGVITVLVCAGAGVAQQQAPALSDVKPGAAAEPETLRLSQKLIDAADFKRAESALRVYLANEDQSAQAHEMLAYCLLRQNRPKDSLAEYTRAAALERPSSAMLEHVGQDYVLLDDWADAERWTMRAVQMDPKNADAWYSLGRIRYHDQRFADAMACFQAALKLAPRSVKAENNIGLTFEAMNRQDEAIAAYRQAIAWQDSAAPGELNEQPLLNLAIVLLHRGELDEAEQLLARAETLAPKDPRVREQLGHVYLQRQNWSRAAEELKGACTLDPANGSLHFLLGQAYRHLGRTAEAKAEFDESARLARTTPSNP